MIYNNYFDMIGEAIEFLIAFGSIMGVLGLIIGVLGMMTLPRYKRSSMYFVLGISILLIAVCGLQTGMRYFRIGV
ncbi:MAG: hypothetical protein ACQERB_12825 [Promethearchaeati archaeon]